MKGFDYKILRNPKIFWYSLTLTALFLYGLQRWQGVYTQLNSISSDVTSSDKNQLFQSALQSRQDAILQWTAAHAPLVLIMELFVMVALAAGLTLLLSWIKIVRQDVQWCVNPLQGLQIKNASIYDIAWGFLFMLWVEMILWGFWHLSGVLGVTWTIPFKLFLGSLLRDAFAVMFVCFMFWKVYRISFAQAGFRWDQAGRFVKIGFLSYLTCLPVFLLATLIVLIVAAMLAVSPSPQEVVKLYFQEDSPSMLIFMSLFAGVLGPIIEEIFFRVFAFNVLESRLGAARALWLSSLLFAVLHAHLESFLPVLCLGFALTYLYSSTRSIIPSITLHLTHNLLMIGLTLWIKSI